jgi:hypothetical protein
LFQSVSDTVSFSQAALTDAQRSQIGDEAATFGLQNVFTGNAAAGALNYVMQRIENVRRLSGKTVTVSFWANSSAALRIGVNISQGPGTGGSPSGGGWALATGVAFTTSTTFQRFTATIAIPSAVGMVFGTNGDNSTTLGFFYSSGATYNATAGNVGVQSGTINIWGVQLEIGSTATPLEKLDPQQDLAKCQRFFSIGAFNYQGATPATGNFVTFTQTLPVQMRAAPTCTSSFSTFAWVTSPSVASNGPDGVEIVGTSAGAASPFNMTGSFTASADL